MLDKLIKKLLIPESNQPVGRHNGHKQYKNHHGQSSSNSGRSNSSVQSTTSSYDWHYLWYADDKEIQEIAREFFDENYWCYGDSS